MRESVLKEYLREDGCRFECREEGRGGGERKNQEGPATPKANDADAGRAIAAPSTCRQQVASAVKYLFTSARCSSTYTIMSFRDRGTDRKLQCAQHSHSQQEQRDV